MNRYIRLDENNIVMMVRFGTYQLENEMEHESAEIGDKLTEDGSFLRQEVQPFHDDSLKFRLEKLEQENEKLKQELTQTELALTEIFEQLGQ